MPASAAKPSPRPPLDTETAAALTLYNTYLVADREQRAHERAVRKAERAKTDAAAAVRKLNEHKGPAAETAAAEAAYREAVDALRRLRDGESAAPGAEASDGDGAAEAEQRDEDTPTGGDGEAEQRDDDAGEAEQRCAAHLR